MGVNMTGSVEDVSDCNEALSLRSGSVVGFHSGRAAGAMAKTAVAIANGSGVGKHENLTK